jgi:hypothetical protein
MLRILLNGSGVRAKMLIVDDCTRCFMDDWKIDRIGSCAEHSAIAAIITAGEGGENRWRFYLL